MKRFSTFALGALFALILALFPSDYYKDMCLVKHNCSGSIVQWLSLGEPLSWFTVVITSPDLESGGFYIDKTYLMANLVANGLFFVVLLAVTNRLLIEWNKKNVIFAMFTVLSTLTMVNAFSHDLFGIIPRRLFPLDNSRAEYRISTLYAISGIPESAIYALEYWEDRGLSPKQSVRIKNPPETIKPLLGKRVKLSGRFVFEKVLRGTCRTYPCETTEYPMVVITDIEVL